MAKKPLGNFENEDRLLSDDEKELLGVLVSFHEAIVELRKEQAELKNELHALRAGFGASLILNKKND